MGQDDGQPGWFRVSVDSLLDGKGKGKVERMACKGRRVNERLSNRKVATRRAKVTKEQGG